MTEHEITQEISAVNKEIIRQAVDGLDAYDSERAKEASRIPAREKNHEVALPERRLSLVGVTHTNNPESPTIKGLRKDMRACLESLPDPRVVEFMIEGWNGGIDAERAAQSMEGVPTIEDAVRRFGEAGVAMWVVAEYKKRGVDVSLSSPEPSFEAVSNTLKAEGYSAEEVAACLTLGKMTSELGGNRLQEDRETTLHNISRTFFDYQSKTGVNWIQDVRSLDEIMKMDTAQVRAYQEKITQEFIGGMNAWLKDSGAIKDDVLTYDGLLDHDLSKVSMKDINELSDPLDYANRGTRINKVAARWNSERDKYLVEQIGKSMAAGKKPYVIYGASHTLHIEPALRKLEEIK